MNKLNLNNVTLACIDDVDPFTARRIMHSLSDRIDFADLKLFSSRSEDYITDRLELPINSLKDYSLFTVKELYKYIDSEFLMFIQRDGYPVNLSGWQDAFLEYDYIGAPWTWVPAYGREHECPIGRCVGNGGFSIRSVKLMEAAAKYDYDPANQGDEDIFICRVIGDELKSEGYKFAPAELASYFSVENWIYDAQFGFHGSKTIMMNQKFRVFNFKEYAYEQDYMD